MHVQTGVKHGISIVEHARGLPNTFIRGAPLINRRVVNMVLVRKVQSLSKIIASTAIIGHNPNCILLTLGFVGVPSSNRPLRHSLTGDFGYLAHHRHHGVPHSVALVCSVTADHPHPAEQFAGHRFRVDPSLKPTVIHRTCCEELVVQLRLGLAHSTTSPPVVALDD